MWSERVECAAISLLYVRSYITSALFPLRLWQLHSHLRDFNNEVHQKKTMKAESSPDAGLSNTANILP